MLSFFLHPSTYRLVREQRRPGRQVRRPGEAVHIQQLLPIEPGIAAKYLIRAFACQRDLVVPLDQAAEVEEGGVHIGHAGQVLHPHRVVQQICQCRLVTL